jgi:gliding motility-associated lipoprotein GldH
MTGVRIRIIIKKASSFLLLLLLLCSCDRTLFHTFSSVGGEWHRDSVVEFVYAGESSPSRLCGMQLEARTDASYRYKNLVVCAGFFNMNDSLLTCDTLPIFVYGDDGHRIGATAGMLYQQESNVVLPDISFRDSVVIRLHHLMSDDVLKGVHDIGVKLMNLD